jgi:zinc transporter ZupT
MPVNLWTVTVAAAITALATGLGAFPLWFVSRGQAEKMVRVGSGAAALLMTAASGVLLWQGFALGGVSTSAGAAAGALGLLLFRRSVGPHDDLVLGRLRGADAMKALVIVGVMTAHSFSEGVGVGVSYGDSNRFGILMTLAIALHNIPEGLAISVVLVPRGAGIRTAALWSVFSSLPQPLIAPLAYLFVEQFNAVLPFGLGLAAGAMLWMVVYELVPELRPAERPRTETP